MDHKLTELIKQWLDTPADKRDYVVGNLYLLRLSGNQIMYRNLAANPAAKAEFIEYQLNKYMEFRLADLTHVQVEEMSKQVEAIVQDHIPLAAEADTQQRGKRDDHDALPDDIKACYVENYSILQRMRELHLKLRSLSLENASCPDSERYPFLKELIALDKKLHANWETYDHYVAEANETDSKPKRNSKASRSKSKSGVSV